MPPKAEWLDELADIAADLGRRPTKAEFTERASVTAEAFYRYYDSWSAVLDIAAEFCEEPALSEPRTLKPAGGHNRIPTDDLLSDLRAAGRVAGRVPSQPEYNHFGQYSSKTQIKRFSSWYDALVAAFGEESVPDNRKRGPPK